MGQIDLSHIFSLSAYHKITTKLMDVKGWVHVRHRPSWT